ncbi:MAG: hypothetical protein HQ582_17335 [Planctomycetes bacterium]|nr:hypothetical protein [Planctomycetota bacterium]
MKTLSLLVAIVCTLYGSNPKLAEAMVYRPVKVPGMGDQWLYYHQGVHYLYHLYELPAGKLHGVYLATSRDGVHFEEVGPVIKKRKDAAWLGSGSVWKAGDKYIMNFSEARAHQSISFACSKDLIHWERLGDEYRSNPDPRWYEVGRWDCIWAIPRKKGGFWGYLSANPWRRSAKHPTGLTYRSTGMLQSDDGVRWNAVAPPVFKWGDTPEMVNVEVGAVTKHNDKYYMMVQTWGKYMGNTAPGMYTFIGDTPQGPFRPDAKAYRILGNTRHRSSHFLRFYRLPNELLVNHFAFTRGLKAWLAPLKKAVFDPQGHLRLGYWKGNDAVKSTPITVALAASGATSRDQSGPRSPVSGVPGGLAIDGRGRISVALLGNKFDIVNGIVLEGALEIKPATREPGRCGIYLQEDARQGTAIMLGTDGRTQLGTLKLQEKPAFKPDDYVQAGIAPGRKHTFRLLTRQYMLEFYLNDRLIQCYSIPERATGRIGFVVHKGRGVIGGLKAWKMNFTSTKARQSQDKHESPVKAKQGASE